MDGDHVEAVEQVLAELPGVDHLAQVAVAGGDYPDVHLDRLVGAQRHHLLLGQHEAHLLVEHAGREVGVVGAGRIAGEVDWTLQTLSIPAGVHTLKWRYAKDPAVSAGQDRGWVDQVAFVPTAVLPPKLVSPRYLAGGLFQCEITGSPGAKYVVEGSTNLKTWVPLATNTAPFTFSEPQPGQFPARMYRARSEP